MSESWEGCDRNGIEMGNRLLGIGSLRLRMAVATALPAGR